VKVVIASVLKPINDPRMFEKFADSLYPDYEIHIIGSPTSNFPSKLFAHLSIYFHTPKQVTRLSMNRLQFGSFFLQKIQQICPNLLIINSPELLFWAGVYKFRHHCPIIYDIRENYFKNLWFQKTYPIPLRYGLALGVRSLEILSRLFVNCYLLAEKSYAQELSFIRNKYVIIENKFNLFQIKINTPNNKNHISKNKIRLIYSGTISKVYGTLEAIYFSQKLHQQNPNIHLLIIGYCSDKNYFEKIEKLCKNQDFITLKMQDKPVLHRSILHKMAQADFGLLSYQSNSSIDQCIPTKIYEFFALQVPMIIPKNPIWEKLVLENKAGLSVDFEDFNAKEILQKLQHTKFYPSPLPDSIWTFEQDKLRQIIQKIMTKNTI